MCLIVIKFVSFCFLAAFLACGPITDGSFFVASSLDLRPTNTIHGRHPAMATKIISLTRLVVSVSILPTPVASAADRVIVHHSLIFPRLISHHHLHLPVPLPLPPTVTLVHPPIPYSTPRHSPHLEVHTRQAMVHHHLSKFPRLLPAATI